jgi:hypothetical protein
MPPVDDDVYFLATAFDVYFLATAFMVQTHYETTGYGAFAQ